MSTSNDDGTVQQAPAARARRRPVASPPPQLGPRQAERQAGQKAQGHRSGDRHRTAGPAGSRQVLTWRQRKVLQVIRESVQRRGYPPSMREIGEAVGLTSTSSVSYQLSTLQSKGYLRRDPDRPRAVEVRLPGHPAVAARARPPKTALRPMDIASQEAAYVPLVGRIAAGGPILAEEAVEDIFPLPRQIVGEGTLFLLRSSATR